MLPYEVRITVPCGVLPYVLIYVWREVVGRRGGSFG